MGKTFHTSEELVEILKAKGVITDDATQAAIERESYYAIVNGYKDPFLDKRAMMSSGDDVYYAGTRFQWMHDLFLFDRDLRIVTFKYLTRAEAVMRTAVAYSFCHIHPEESAYTNRANFCTWNSYLVPKSFKGNKRSLYQTNLGKLMKLLSDKLVLKPKSRAFVKHYLKKHGTVPLWVLANDLTFGNVIHFYQLMEVDARREACRIVAKTAKRDKDAQGHLTERRLLRAASVLNDFRCLCAHDERLYCARFDNDDFSTMTRLMADLIPGEEVAEFIREVLNLIFRYKDKLHRINPYTLLENMGFDLGATTPRYSGRTLSAMPPEPIARKSAQRAMRRLNERRRRRNAPNNRHNQGS